MRDQAGKDRAGKMDEAMTLARMLGLWNAMPKPVNGRVHGAAYGGGLGLIPPNLGPFVVGRPGEAFARQVFFNTKPLDTAFLIRAEVVARACPSETLDGAVEEEVAALLQCAPGAVAEAKALCRALAGRDPVEAAAFSASALADRWETEETRDGIAAFFAKEDPVWRRG